jgi:hypothetical protein
MNAVVRLTLPSRLKRGLSKGAIARRAIEGAALHRARRAAVRRTGLLALTLAVSGLLLVAGPLTGTARANGVPTLVNLSYIDLSNWGPEDATGTVELLFAEGLVNISITGLPELTDERYQGWLVNSQVGDAITVGRFNADASDVVSFQGVLPPIADFGFDLFVVTVEEEPDAAPQPSETRSIGGYFSLVGESSSDQTGSDSAGPSNAPTELPATGDFALLSDIVRVGLLLAVMGLSMFVALRLGRRAA